MRDILASGGSGPRILAESQHLPQENRATGSATVAAMHPVVGAAIVRDARVLAARRTRPAAAAGRWEFPGGKVEGAESPDAALVREIGEELGCVVKVERWLDGAAPIGTTHELTVAVVRIIEGEPVPHEHDAVQWLRADELDDVDWLEPDRPFLTELAELLRASA